MKTYCPYNETCTIENDAFLYAIPYMNGYVNKCISCGKWSYHDMTTQTQEKLPEELQNNSSWEQ